MAERAREYFRWRLEEAVAALPADSSALSEALSEMLALVIGEDEIEGWRPPALAETLSKITEPLASCTHGAKC